MAFKTKIKTPLIFITTCGLAAVVGAVAAGIVNSGKTKTPQQISGGLNSKVILSARAAEPQTKVTVIDPGNQGKVAIVDTLFDNQDSALPAVPPADPGDKNTNYSLGNLFVLDRLFDQGVKLDANNYNLGDLLILDRIFNNGATDKHLNLGELIVLDRLFSGQTILTPGDTTIGDLLVLDRIFNGQ